MVRSLKVVRRVSRVPKANHHRLGYAEMCRNIRCDAHSTFATGQKLTLLSGRPMSAVIPHTGLSAVHEAAVPNTLRISQPLDSHATHRQQSFRSERRSARPRHRRSPSFCCGTPEKHARVKGLEKSQAQFGSPLTPAIERRFRRSSRSLTRRRTRTAVRRSGCGPESSRRSTAGAADRGGAPGGAARPKQTIPARGRSVARAAPGARAGGNIRPRGAAHTLAPPGAPFPCLWLGLVSLGVAWR